MLAHPLIAPGQGLGTDLDHHPARPEIGLEQFFQNIIRGEQIAGRHRGVVGAKGFLRRVGPHQRGDVLGGIPYDRDQVRFHSERDLSETASEAEGFRREGCGRDDRLMRFLSSLLDTVDELFDVSSVGARDGIGTEDHLQLRHGEARLEHLEYGGERLLHLAEAFLRIVSGSEVAGLVVEIVLEHVIGVGIEEETFLRDEVQGLGVEG